MATILLIECLFDGAVAAGAPPPSPNAYDGDAPPLGILGFCKEFREFAAGTTLSPGVGSITITGYAPTISRSGNVDLEPDAGAVTITGYAPTMVQSSLGSGVLDPADLAAIEALLAPLLKVFINKMITDPDTGLMTIYDDDGVTILYQGPIKENVAGTQPYRGRGADRRDKLEPPP